MDQKILIAIIAAGSALMGSLIPTALSLVNTSIQNKYEFKKLLSERQREVYLELMTTLQEYMNDPPANFTLLQKATNKAAIYGDLKTAKAFYSYYKDFVRSNQNHRDLLTKEEHQKHNLEIINCIRESIGLDPMEEFEIVVYRPQK